MNALDVVAKALRRSSRPYDDATAVLTALHEAGFTLRPPTRAVPPCPAPAGNARPDAREEMAAIDRRRSRGCWRWRQL